MSKTVGVLLLLAAFCFAGSSTHAYGEVKFNGQFNPDDYSCALLQVTEWHNRFNVLAEGVTDASEGWHYTTSEWKAEACPYVDISCVLVPVEPSPQWPVQTATHVAVTNAPILMDFLFDWLLGADAPTVLLTTGLAPSTWAGVKSAF